MNASRLLEIINLLIKEEAKSDIQGKLNDLNTHLANLVSQPADPTHQKALSSSIKKLEQTIQNTVDYLQPAQIKLLEEIGADEYFISDMPARITSLVNENLAAPAVAQQELTEFIQARQAYIQKLNQLSENLKDMGVTVSSLEEGKAEIGFSLPRELFENNFENLISELEVIKRIIRAFSEATTGSVEIIEVRQISTSDPLIFLGLDISVIVALGGAVTWALLTWEQVEKIRKIRLESAQIEQLQGEPYEEMLDITIQKTIKTAIDNKTAELLEGIDEKSGRVNEQETHIKWALESIIARVERGMTVEVRVLPPADKEPEEGEEAEEALQVYRELEEISGQLVFPKVEGTPILALPSEKPDNKDRTTAKTKK